MTDLIPRDAAIAAVNTQTVEGDEDWIAGNNSAISSCCVILRAIPAIDPAAIREAALKEAIAYLSDRGHWNAIRAILALIGEKK